LDKGCEVVCSKPARTEVHGAICSCLLLCAVACNALAETAVDNRAILEQVRSSFDFQGSLFNTVRFQARLISPYMNPDKPEANTGLRRVIDQTYTLSKQGKFLFSDTRGILDLRSGNVTLDTDKTEHLAFDGETYRYYNGTTDSGLGSIFTPEQPYDWSKPMTKPIFFMDHLFDEKIKKALNNKQCLTIDTSDGYWRIEYKAPELADATDSFVIYCDPKQDFMIVKSEGFWTPTKRYCKETQYAMTEEGFYYPVKGKLTVGSEIEVTLEVTEFELNAPQPSYALEFPVGIRVTDHTRGLPRIYYEGQPGKTATETGDRSIYTLADSMNRVALESVSDALSEPKVDTPTTAEHGGAPVAPNAAASLPSGGAFARWRWPVLVLAGLSLTAVAVRLSWKRGTRKQ
jgi:hypothetical protein